MSHASDRRGTAALASIVLALVLLASCSDGDGRRTPDAARAQPSFSPSEPERVTEPVGDWFESSCAVERELIVRVRRGYQHGPSPDVLVIPRQPNFFGGFVNTGHSGPWDYLMEVPLVFYGPGFIRRLGRFDAGREVTVADLAPTIGEVVGTRMPDATGTPLDQILVPESEREGRPRLVLTVVWDGGGTNVLETWPGYWPELEKLIDGGAAPNDANVGSSPSVTPATHTNMGTGAFPQDHGVSGITIRQDGALVDSFKGQDADAVKLPMLGDLHDSATANAAKIGMFAYKNWHLGMMSHGATNAGDDKDLAAFLNTREQYETNSNRYYMPGYLDEIAGLRRAIRKVDLDDGTIDRHWMGHDILGNRRYRRDTPAWVIHQTNVIKAILKREGFGVDEVPDLFFTNYKQPDEAGHNWNMLSPEVAEVVRYTDAQLAELVTFLNRHVGRKRWVMVVTADHGQQPPAQESNGWPISMAELVEDANEHFALDELLFGSAGGMWMDRQLAASANIAAKDVANFLVDYRIEDNIAAGREDEIPAEYAERYREPIFSAAFPGGAAKRVEACAADGGS